MSVLNIHKDSKQCACGNNIMAEGRDMIAYTDVP